MAQIHCDQVLDTSGKCCPMPIVDLNKAIKKLDAGQVLGVVATDPGTKTDIPSWCERTGNKLLSSEIDGTTLRYYVLKG